MRNNYIFNFQQKPAWQRYLIYAVALIAMATLFSIGLIFVFAFAFLAIAVAIINKIKFKLTGRPLFAGPQHFHRYQSQFKKDNVIEGELVEPTSSEQKKGD